MKAHLTKVSLALLSTVFLLGCQDLGPEPVGPEGLLFDKKGTGPCAPPEEQIHCHGDDEPTGEATFTATFVNSAGEDCTVAGVGCQILGTIDMIESAVGLTSRTMLDLTFFRNEAVITGGTICFNSRSVADPASVFKAPFQITVKKNELPNVRTFFGGFKAKGTDGSEVKYALHLPGVVRGGGTFSPDPGAITMIELKPLFSMNHSNGPGKSVACTGTGPLSSFIKVEGTTGL